MSPVSFTTSLPSADNPGTNPPGNFIYTPAVFSGSGVGHHITGYTAVKLNIRHSFSSNLGPIHESNFMCSYTTLIGPQSYKMEDEPRLVDLLNEVAARIPSKWREVGIQLHLNPDHLDGIEVSVSSPHDRFCSVFTLWKKQMTAPYKWATVIHALKAAAVNEIRLAEELKNRVTV